MNCTSLINDKNILTHLKNYKCVEKLGQGAYGITFLMKKGNKKIALKILPIKKKSVLETKILKTLSSSCSKKRVLCYHDTFDGKKFHYIVTEYITGVNLREYEFKDNILFYKFISQLIDAVDYIHSLGVIHFDIKPENIMITKDNNLKLIDFGAAAYPSSCTHRILCKTPYFSPNTWNVKNFNQGRYFDWYTVITTIKRIAGTRYKDLNKYLKEPIPFNENILKLIKSIKTLSSKHFKVKENVNVEDIKNKQCPVGKILNPKSGRCVKIDGKIGKSLL